MNRPTRAVRMNGDLRVPFFCLHGARSRSGPNRQVPFYRQERDFHRTERRPDELPSCSALPGSGFVTHDWLRAGSSTSPCAYLDADPGFGLHLFFSRYDPDVQTASMEEGRDDRSRGWCGARDLGPDELRYRFRQLLPWMGPRFHRGARYDGAWRPDRRHVSPLVESVETGFAAGSRLVRHCGIFSPREGRTRMPSIRSY